LHLLQVQVYTLMTLILIINAGGKYAKEIWFIGNRRDDVANVGQIGNLFYSLPPNMVVYPGKSQRARNMGQAPYRTNTPN